MKSARVVSLILALLGCITLANHALQATQQQPLSDTANLDGLWLSNCYEFEPQVYQVRTFEFVLNHLATITTMTYPDTLCSEVPVESNVIFATWDLGDTVPTEEGLSVNRLDVLLKAGPRQELTTVKQVVHIKQDTLVLGINQQLDQYPGSLDWAITYQRIEN